MELCWFQQISHPALAGRVRNDRVCGGRGGQRHIQPCAEDGVGHHPVRPCAGPARDGHFERMAFRPEREIYWFSPAESNHSADRSCHWRPMADARNFAAFW